MSANFTPYQLTLAIACVHAEAAGYDGLAAAFAGILRQPIGLSNHPQEAGASSLGHRTAGNRPNYGKCVIECEAGNEIHKDDLVWIVGDKAFSAVERPLVSPTLDR